MAEGFVVDESYGTRNVPYWFEGRPEKSIWTGLNPRGRASHGVVTWRCGRCSYLESYAPG